MQPTHRAECHASSLIERHVPFILGAAEAIAGFQPHRVIELASVKLMALRERLASPAEGILDVNFQLASRDAPSIWVWPERVS